jgi:hypothetical protein
MLTQQDRRTHAVLRFTIPFLPPSINCSQTFSSRIREGKVTMRVETSAAARTFKSQSKMYMPKYTLDEDKVYEVRIRLCGNWLTQRLVPKDKDLRNHAELVLEATLERYAAGRMGKLIVDAVFANYKTSDKLIWVDRLEKVQSVDERVEVTIDEYAPNGIPVE